MLEREISLGDGLLAVAAATAGVLAAAIIGDFDLPLTVLVDGTDGEGARSLATEAEIDPDGNGDRDIVGVAALGSEVEGGAGGAFAIALPGAGLLLLTAIARVEGESGVGTRVGDAVLEAAALGTAVDESAGDMGPGGATGLGLSLSMLSMTRLEEYLIYRCWNAK
jgi:hypothetical protein